VIRQAATECSSPQLGHSSGIQQTAAHNGEHPTMQIGERIVQPMFIAPIHSEVRPPTPTRIRISANDTEPQSVVNEVQGLRMRVRDLESENSRLKSRLNGMASEQSQLQTEVERYKASELQIRMQAERLEKQRKSIEASSDITAAYKILKLQVIKIAEKLRSNEPNWFVSFGSFSRIPKQILL
jgi:uncharacterized protein (DUF3084 family)